VRLRLHYAIIRSCLVLLWKFSDNISVAAFTRRGLNYRLGSINGMQYCGHAGRRVELLLRLMDVRCVALWRPAEPPPTTNDRQLSYFTHLQYIYICPTAECRMATLQPTHGSLCSHGQMILHWSITKLNAFIAEFNSSGCIVYRQTSSFWN